MNETFAEECKFQDFNKENNDEGDVTPKVVFGTQTRLGRTGLDRTKLSVLRLVRLDWIGLSCLSYVW